jgi:hypothetical protein
VTRALKGVASLMVGAVVVALATGCGSSSSTSTSTLPTKVPLAVDTKSTGGKALVFTATTDKKLAAQKGGLRGRRTR